MREGPIRRTGPRTGAVFWTRAYGCGCACAGRPLAGEVQQIYLLCQRKRRKPGLVRVAVDPPLVLEDFGQGGNDPLAALGFTAGGIKRANRSAFGGFGVPARPGARVGVEPRAGHRAEGPEGCPSGRMSTPAPVDSVEDTSRLKDFDFRIRKLVGRIGQLCQSSGKGSNPTESLRGNGRVEQPCAAEGRSGASLVEEQAPRRRRPSPPGSTRRLER